MTNKTRRRVLRAGAGGAGLVAAVAALEYARRRFRDARVFGPAREPVISWNPADYGFDPERVDDFFFTNSDGQRLHAWYCRAEKPVASILHCHGNRGNLTSVAASVRFLVEQGFNVFVYDYRGYGRSDGRPSIPGVINDARAAAAEHNRRRPAHLPSILYGYSLGGAIAAQVVTEFCFDGIVLQSTFTNLAEITRHLFPGLPFHRLCGRELDTRSIISKLTLPLLVIHGTSDWIVPCRMGRDLYDAAVARKTLEMIDGCAHKDLELKHAPRISAAVKRFVDSLAAAPAPA